SRTARGALLMMRELSSCQPVANQELQRAVEADLRRRPRASACIRHDQWRTEARRTHLPMRRGIEDRLRTLRQLARKDRSLAHAVEDLAPDLLARLGHACDSGQFVATGFDPHLACR